MKFSRKYTRKNKRNGKTKKNKKGGKVPKPPSPPFQIPKTPRRPVDPQNDPSRFRTTTRTNPPPRQPNNIVQRQADDIGRLLEMTSG